MTTFEVHNKKNNEFQWILRFDTRFTPVILYGNVHNCQDDCLKEINLVRQQILDMNRIKCCGQRNRHSFNIISAKRRLLATSRFFPEQQIMERIIAILQKHLPDAAIRLADVKMVSMEMAA